MTSRDDPLGDGRETFENLVQRVAAHPIAEAKEAIAGQLFPVDKRVREIRDAIEELREAIEKHHRGDISFQASAREELTALRSGQDELRAAVHEIGERFAGAEGRLATAVRYLAVLYVLLTVALGLVVVLLVTQT